MTQLESAAEAFDQLWSARADAMPLTRKMERRLAGLTTERLIALATQESESSATRRAASLLVARGYLDSGDEDGRVDLEVLMRSFLRHVEISGSDENQPDSRRQAFGAAAEQIRIALGESKQRSAPQAGQSAWRESMGMGEGQFMQLVSQSLGLTIESIEPSEVPNWLDLSKAADPDPYLSNSAPWSMGASNPEVDLQDRVNTAWVAFRDGTPALSNEHLREVRRLVGSTWGPGSSAESRHLWNWIRFVHELMAARDSNSGQRRRMISIATLYSRLPPAATRSSDELAPWLDPIKLAADVMHDLRPGDPEVETLMGVYSARLSNMVPDHEPVVVDLSNTERAALREIWRERFDRVLGSSSTSTNDMYRAISEDFDHLLESSADCPRAAAEKNWSYLFDLSKAARPYCDPVETRLLEQAAELLRSIAGHERRSVWTLGDLEDLGNEIVEVSLEIRSSGSLLIQEIVLPFLRAGAATIARARADHEEQAPAEVAITLGQRTYPIFGHLERTFELSLEAVNRSEIDVINLSIRLESGHLSFEPEEAVLSSVQPGYAGVASFTAKVLEHVEEASLNVRASWTDEFERPYETSVEFFIQSERASKWSENVINPFSLNAIDVPDRLVGRNTELLRLKQLATSGQSTYVTGHKRVGKTSLVRVLVRILQTNDVASGRITLGQAISESPQASQLAYAILYEAHRVIASHWSLEIQQRSHSEFKQNFAHEGGRWLSDLRSGIPEDGHVVVAIDDFDELPDSLVDGDEGDALFRFLRSLVEEPWLSLIFVGSEVLPAIITGRQGVKLNTVSQTALLGFSEPSATYELLRSASVEFLDWDEEALARIHLLSSGNPYYATLLGFEVWNQMHLENRTLVHLSDVERAVESVVGITSDSHFVHFWTDGPSGLEVESERAVTCAAYLRGCALSVGRDAGGWASTTSAEATALEYLVSATREAVVSARQSLVNRGVLAANADGSEVRIAVPLLAAWLRGTGGRTVMDRLFSSSQLGKDASYVIPPGEILELAEDWYYQDERVNEIRINAWLDQFEDGRDRFIAFQVLKDLRSHGYFDASRMEREVWPALNQALLSGGAGQYQQLSNSKKGGRQYRENFFLLQRNKRGTSADIANRHMATNLKIRKTTNIISMDRLDRVLEAGRRHRAVLFVVDDFGGTGNQATEIRDELTASLDALDPAWRDRVLLAIGLGLVMDGDLIQSVASEGVMVSFGAEISPSLKLKDGQPTSLSPELADHARDLFSTIGRQLVPDAPLGYGDHGMLVSFADNCPNNSLPAFWHHGNVAGKRWVPLLPRRQ